MKKFFLTILLGLFLSPFFVTSSYVPANAIVKKKVTIKKKTVKHKKAVIIHHHKKKKGTNKVGPKKGN